MGNDQQKAETSMESSITNQEIEHYKYKVLDKVSF
jgi:hypothetical protein